MEDPFDQEDWKAWQKFTTRAGIQVIGDDLTVTSPERLAKAVSCHLQLPPAQNEPDLPCDLVSACV